MLGKVWLQRITLGALLLTHSGLSKPAYAAEKTPAAAASTPASPPVRRTVHLRSGESVSGYLVELIEKQQITLLLPSGELRTIPFLQIRSIEDFSIDTVAALPLDSVGLDADIVLRVQSDKPVELWTDPKDSRGRLLFSNLFDRQVWVPAVERFEVKGAGIPSASFRLTEARAAQVNIVTGSTAQRGVGIALGVLGGGACAGGFGLFLFTGLGALFVTALGGNASSDPQFRTVLTTGGVLLAVGSIPLALGIVLALRGDTKVQLTRLDSQASLQLSAGLRLSPRGLEF